MSRRTMRRGMLRSLLASAAAAVLVLTGAMSAMAEEVPTATITGTVTSEADGTPLAGVSIGVSGVGSGLWFDGTTDANGGYAIAGLPAGEYVVQFVPANGSGLATEYWDDAADWFSADRVQAVGGETVADIDAALAAPPAPGTITGTVTREDDGSPVVGATVSASKTGAGWGWGSTTTGADGSYTLPSLNPGAYILTFQAEGTDLVTEYWDDATEWSAATPVELASGGAVTGIHAQLAVGGTVSGTVVRTLDGASVAGVTVEALDERGEIKRQTQSGADGSYQLAGLATGSYAIHFQTMSDPSLASEFWEDARTLSAAAPVSVTAGQMVGAISASLENVGHLTGRITKASDGSAVVGVNVMAEDAASGDFVGNGSVGPDGAYHLALAPGTYKLRVFIWQPELLAEYWQDAYSADDATAVTVIAGETRGGFDFQLDAPAVVTGTVTMASEEDHEVIVEAYDGKTLVASAHASLADGTYQLYVPAGTYTLKASAIFYKDSSTTAKPQWSGGVRQQKKATPVAVTTDAPVSGMDFTLVAKTE